MTLKSYRLWDNLEKYGRGRKGHRWQYNTVHALFVLHQLRLHTHTRNTQYLLLFPSNNGCKNAPQNYVYTYVIRPLFLSNKYTRCTQWTIQKLPFFLRLISSGDVSVGTVARLRATQPRDSISIHDRGDRCFIPQNLQTGSGAHSASYLTDTGYSFRGNKTTGSVKSTAHLHLLKLKLNSVALVRERTIPTERPPPVDEVSANFCG